ncbi:MAG TPA: hypothetical protein VFZ16_15420 [Hyphomicrobiaceae bacterium]|nr:hypothetical protein [Hyphomicrobiaceae bacterium]
MPYMVKKVGGLVLVLLGGLTVAHGAVGRLGWEILGGLIVMALGAGLMGAKILRRNTVEPGRRQ